MATVSIAEMREIEAKAFAAGCTEEQLIEAAGEALAHALARCFPGPRRVVGYLGKGHNAADTLVALRVLRDVYHWQASTRCAFAPDAWARQTRRAWEALNVNSDPDAAAIDPQSPAILLDGLLGIGGRGALTGALADLAREMAQLRNSAGATVVAVDLPSGLDADSGIPAEGTVVADLTFMLAQAKLGALMESAINSCGRLAVVPIEALSVPDPGDAEMSLIAPQEMSFGKSPRPFDFHKGMAGRVGVIAGSLAYPGAAALAALGALRGGAGLVMLHVPASCLLMVAGKCPPEIILRGFTSLAELNKESCDSWVLGCGWGPPDADRIEDFFCWLAQTDLPTVLDADALNWLASADRLDAFGAHHVLTPHPGEFRRLAPDLADLPRAEAARSFVNRHPATLLLKGARSLVAKRDQPLWVNSTGTPGMACGGQGDLLAGMIGALLARGMGGTESAAMAAWLCGRAAETALTEQGCSPESLTPSDTAKQLGRAFQDWRNATR